MNKENKYKILCLIDVQNDFITGTLANEEAQRVLPNIVEKINNFSGDAIYLTMDTHFDNYLETNEGKHLPVKHCICGTDGWAIEESVYKAVMKKKQEGVTVHFFIKETFGSLRDLEIPTMKQFITIMRESVEVAEKNKQAKRYSMIQYIKHLHNKNRKMYFDVEYLGFCTDICLISNVLSLEAMSYDYADITVDSNCCAGVTPEKHEAALEVMRSCQINVI